MSSGEDFKKSLEKQSRKFFIFEKINKDINRVFITDDSVLLLRSFYKCASKLLPSAAYVQPQVGTDYLLGQASVDPSSGSTDS